MSMSNKTDIKALDVKTLFSSDRYIIPIYQRNYAWGTDEVRQLIQDVNGYASSSPKEKYYLGNLIVFENRDDDGVFYETIDGQQRLTTLFIILSALKNVVSPSASFVWFEKSRLSFKNRDNSCLSLEMAFTGKTEVEQSDEESIDGQPCEIEYEEHIVEMYNLVPQIIKQECKTDKDQESFISYLLNQVVILRIPVPEWTDRNHYFEIMNSRGVQLEQYEIVKERLLKPFDEGDSTRKALEIVWEACSNMEKYVQMNFSNAQREIFGGQWTQAPASDMLETLKTKINAKDEEKLSLLTMYRVTKGGKTAAHEKITDEQEIEDQFHSVIDFDNFLLHVLKIIRPDDTVIALDDRRLVEIFDEVMEKEKDKQSFSIEFISSLLQVRYLFDTYVIKTKKDEWSLKKIRSRMQDNTRQAYYVCTFGDEKSEINDIKEELIVLQSMFHVSTPTMTHKYWLNATLNYLYQNFYGKQVTEFTEKSYVKFLIGLSKCYLLDNYLAGADSSYDYFDIIYKNDCEPQNPVEQLDWSRTGYRQCPPNFLFNCYDYILWRENPDCGFVFRYRTSVEHFYPQNPKAHPMNPESLHKFGNLCLISSGMNSMMGNNLPVAKKADFGDMPDVRKISIKLNDMLSNAEKWNKDMIDAKDDEAKGKIIGFLNSKI